MSEKPTKYPTSRVRQNLGDAYVNKSNALIRSSYRLTLNEQRIILASIAKLDSRRIAIRPGFDQVSRIRIYAQEFAETFGISQKDAYDALREGAAKLYDRSVQTYDGKIKGRFRWIMKEEYADGEGYVQISFTPDAAQYLTQLRNKFTSYQLKRVAHLKSIYSIRLFEYLASYRETGVFKITLGDFIRDLELPYDRWVHVKQRVIDPAVEELKAKSNIELTYDVEKVGRRIAMIIFHFQLAAQGRLDFIGEETQNSGDEETQNSGAPLLNAPEGEQALTSD